MVACALECLLVVVRTSVIASCEVSKGCLTAYHLRNKRERAVQPTKRSQTTSNYTVYHRQ